MQDRTESHMEFREGADRGDGPILQVQDLQVAFRGSGYHVVALAGVNFRIYPRQVACIVGESGCGKTLSALSIMNILPKPPACVEGGRILYLGRDLLTMPEEALQRIRGREISMIFQEPMTSLNPVFTVGYQIAEAIQIHEKPSQTEIEHRVNEMLSRVGISAPEERKNDYPHQLSGGQRQRAMIAMALACNPRLVIADEPTTALDVTIQAQILRLFQQLQEAYGMSLLYITHDLRVVAYLAHQVFVMYAGMMVEESDARSFFHTPRHPYSRGLMASLPGKTRRSERLHTIPGRVPDPANRPPGCPFHPRCPLVTPRCREELPSMCDFGDGHLARCPVVHGSWPTEKNRLVWKNP